MVFEGLGQSTELDSYHCNIGPSFRTGRCRFIIPHQPTVAHQPPEGALHHPTAWQDLKSSRIVRTLDDLHPERGTQIRDPRRESGASVTAIDPEQAKPGKDSDGLLEQGLG